MSDIVKICKIHGRVINDQVYIYKNSYGKECLFCELCRSLNNAKYKVSNKEKILKSHKISQRKYDKKPSSVESRRVRKLKNEYGLSIDGYDSLLFKQDSLCAICKEIETYVDYRTKNVKRLCVDHCHKTGKIRELICYRCNIALGKFQDSIDKINTRIYSGKSKINVSHLQSMIEYLRRHQR